MVGTTEMSAWVVMVWDRGGNRVGEGGKGVGDGAGRSGRVVKGSVVVVVGQ